MIILEFLVFVVTSGLFCSEKFRGHIWAVIVAGIVATGSSLLFVYDLGAKLAGHEKEPSVITKIVRQTVVKTAQYTQPASAGRPHSCIANYPAEALRQSEEGITSLGFKILTDGTVDAVKVLASSGSKRLDKAAVNCVAGWHYRPAIKNGQLVETDWKASVKWVLPGHDAANDAAPAPPKESPAKAPPDDNAPAWYDVGSWFGSNSDKKTSR